MNQWLDISQRLNENTPYWPGDTQYSYRLNSSMAEGSSVNVGEIRMSTHLGTHIDAPYHFDENGKKIIELDLDLYIGTATVVKVDAAESIGIKAFEGIELTGVRRLLVATGQWKDLSRFPEWIPPVEPDLAPFLANKGVRLLGLDLPSVDCLDSKELPAHNKLSGCGIHILEGLVLDGLEPGLYDLAALPLALEAGGGSPVRAVVKKKG
ncbi:arylformamidase [Peribacillus frigoritolerans]|uniref:arylformamidase n=1 Tax=Peribacillus frigoritolerans TaxID=450367 RepID=UPI00227F3AF3|nr:arylformamidase [Peribacillus frigoritolerans]MCY8936340.1 arylformamidase [Peribacillus frigoritolerans]